MSKSRRRSPAKQQQTQQQTAKPPSAAGPRATGGTQGSTSGYLDGLLGDGLFGGAVDGALEQAFGSGVQALPGAIDDPEGNRAIHAKASTQGNQISLGTGIDPHATHDAASMAVIGEEVAHALAGGGSGETHLDQPGDTGEASAKASGERFARFVTQGGPAPSLGPALGGRASIHRAVEDGEADTTVAEDGAVADVDTAGVGLGDPSSGHDLNVEAARNSADKAGVEGAGDLPTISLVDGRPSVQIGGHSFDGRTATVGFARDQSLGLRGEVTDRYREVIGEDGELAGSYLDTGIGGAISADVRAGPGAAPMISGSYGMDFSTRVLASLGEDGTALDEEALRARGDLMEHTEVAGTEDERMAEVRALIEGVSVWGEGDQVRTALSREGSLGLARPGLISAGISGGGSHAEERVVEMMENGVARVTMTETDTTSLSVSAGAGFNALTATLGGDNATSGTQVLEFDLNDPAGQRDYALNHFAGLMPGSAEALGITTFEDAQAFIANGGMEGLDTWDRLPEDFGFEGTAELNAAMLERARDPENAEWSEANGYRSLEEERQTGADARLGFLGLNLASASWDRSEGETMRFENGRPVVEYTGTSTYAQGGLIPENGQEGSRMVADRDGAFAGTYWGSFDESEMQNAGPLAERVAEDDDAAALIDDPTFVRTVSGDLSALGAAYAGMDVEAEARVGDTIAALDHARDLLATARENGTLAPDDHRRDTDIALAIMAVEEGEAGVETLDAIAAEVYAANALLVLDGDERFHAIGQLAGHPDPEIAATVMAQLVATGDADVMADFNRWIESHPELAGTVTVETAMVAGNRDLTAATAALAAGDGETAAARAGEVLAAIEASGLDPELLDQTLAGFDLSAATEERGGLEGLFTALPAEDRGRFLAAAGGTESGRQLVLDLAATHPERLIDPNVPEAERAAWAAEHLGPILGDDFDPEVFAASANEGMQAALAIGDAWSLGPEAGAAMEQFRGDDDRTRMASLETLREQMGFQGDMAAFVGTLSTQPMQVRDTLLDVTGRIDPAADPRLLQHYGNFGNEILAQDWSLLESIPNDLAAQSNLQSYRRWLSGELHDERERMRIEALYDG